MRIAVARETREGETRVALVPELVGKLTGLGYEVAVEPGAGEGALHSDQDYQDAGAVVSDGALDGAALVVSVGPLESATVRRLAEGTATMSFLPVNQSLDLVADLRDCGVTSFAMELVPRISRAQSMDALSSQALVAGYRCAVVAAGLLRRFFPLNMTAAGTVPPAEVVVLGAGVAGLQAIATCKRLGAVVKAYDVRAAAAEEIRSMGAQSIDLELSPESCSGGTPRGGCGTPPDAHRGGPVTSGLGRPARHRARSPTAHLSPAAACRGAAPPATARTHPSPPGSRPRPASPTTPRRW